MRSYYIDLLDDKEQNKLLILKYLELSKDEYTTISKLEELVGESKFRIKGYLSELTDNLKVISKSSKLSIYGEEIRTQNVDLMIIKKMQIYYFKHSYPFRMFLSILEFQTPIERFAKDNFISLSKAYTIRKKVINFCKFFNANVKNNQVCGNEIELRNTLYTLFFEVFNDLEMPFSRKINESVQQLLEYISTIFILKLSPTDVMKFRVVLTVTMCRIYTKNHISDTFFYLNNNIDTKLSDLHSFLKKMFPNSNDSNLLNEVVYIGLFISLEFPDHTVKNLFKKNLFKKIDIISSQICKSTINMIEQFYHITVNVEQVESFHTEVERINRKHKYFGFHTASFSTREQIQFVFELYPVYSRIVEKIVHENIRRLKFNLENIEIRLFYDYVFSLIDILPPNRLENPIYICIDFSQGSAYTKFISNQIARFKDLNLIVEKRLSSNTNIYVSDCLIEKFLGVQVIWKSPPTPADWEYFGNKLIDVKQSNF